MSTIIGLDIGSYSIKALRLEVDYKTFRASAWDEEVLDTVIAVPELAIVRSREGLPDGTDPQSVITEDELEAAIHQAEDESLLVALTNLRERGALDAETIAVAMPPDLILSTRMSFPFTDPRQLAMVIPSQFEESSLAELDQLLLDHHVVGPTAAQPGMNDILVTAARNDDIQTFLDLWRAGGVDPHYVLMADASMLHLASYLVPEVGLPFAIVDIGHRFTRVACIEPDPRGASAGAALGLTRTFQYGGHQLTLELQRVLGSSYPEAEAWKHQRAMVGIDTMVGDHTQIHASDALKSSLQRLVRELLATFHAHLAERRVGISRVYVCGGTSRLRNLLPWLEEALGVEVVHLPIAGEELAGLARLDERARPTAALALALGLRDVVDRKQLATINFRRGRFEHEGRGKWLRSRLIGLGAAAAVLLVALTFYFITSYLSLDAQLEATDAAVSEATGRLFEKPTTDLARIKRELKGGEADAGVLPRYSAYDMYYELSTRVPEGIKVELYDIRIDLLRQLIKVEGETDSAASVDQLAASYEGFVCFKDQVKKGDVESVGEKVKFSLNISPQCTPPTPDKKKKKT